MNSPNPKPISLIVWLSIGSALLVSIAGIGFLFFNPTRISSPDHESAKTVAKEFLEKIRKGDIDQAWESTSSDFKSYMGKATFRSLVKKTPAFREPLNENAPPVEDGNKGLKCEFVSTRNPKKITVILVQEKNTTKVAGLQTP